MSLGVGQTPLTEVGQECYPLVSKLQLGVMGSVWKVGVLVPLSMVLLASAGCTSLREMLGLGSGESTVEPVDGSSGEQIGTQVLTTSDDGNVLVNEEAGIELTLPAAWSENVTLHESAELEASDTERQLYIIVVAEDDETLLRLGLKENAQRYRDLLINRLQAFSTQAPTDVAFIGDNFADQYEIRGQVGDGSDVVYLHTTVVTEERYYQVVAWTTPDQYETYKSELQAIADTFREMNTDSDT